jgi:class 3 adenylate cyclase/tetratricopeptide (TPR) repeat protein
MTACPNCGRENPADARFCNACGATLEVGEPERESRKVVTVLFCDLVGSTTLGESTDPEALRARMRRYFEDLRAILERHGGTVEKFVGDAVMAVFGIPVSHEDDALRAVRAAAEMQEAVSAHGLDARIGVNTGEVVVGGQGETLVTGDAVNVAARLEQAAHPGEVLIGAETRLLVRGAVRLESVEPLTLKGKSTAVDAFRVLEVLVGAEPVARHLERALVGRERERQRLRRDYEDAVADRTCRLFTLLGPAGIGKSRLVADFLDGVGESADVLRGRCLSYGEGITYWPLIEILSAIGIAPEAVIGTSPAETQLAFRRLLEGRAAEQPQVVVIDDLQWAEPAFVDLVEHVADLSRGVPVFLLCVARTELLDARPDWGGGKLNATSLLLEPLADDECAELIERLVADAPLDPELRERIRGASGGNPLYMEEMLAMVREHGGSDIVVPPTIHALLQARIDTLDSDVRVVMERGAVEGEVFHRGSVAELAPPTVQPAVASHLATLVRKELIRGDNSVFADDEAFRFRHLLIRDAAYESLPKATRAQLHERFADWLGKHELVERDEILGYHLEQAHRYRAELDPDDPALAELSGRVAEHLGAAGRAALERGDFHAARTLLDRAVALLRPDDERVLGLAPERAAAYSETDLEVSVQALDAALGASDPVTRARSAVARAGWALSGSAELPRDERERLREEARAVFEAKGHDVGLAEYWLAVANEAWFACRAADSASAAEQALAHIERAGASHSRIGDIARSRLRGANLYSPLPIDDALDWVVRMARDDISLLGQARQQITMGALYGMKGDVERGRALFRAGRGVCADAGLLVTAGGSAIAGSAIESDAGNYDEAETLLREGLAQLEEVSDRAFSPTVAVELALVVLSQRRFAEVPELLERARTTSGADDIVNFIFADFIEGALLAHEGRLAEAEALGRRAVELADTTDYTRARPLAYSYLAETLALRGESEEARTCAAVATGILEAKGNLMLAARLRERLAAVGVDA